MFVYYAERLPRFDAKDFFGVVGKERAEKLSRLTDARAAELSCAAFLLLAHALEERFGVEPPPAFAFFERGKPYLPDRPDVFFNMSHTDGAVAVAVSDKTVGIDIQSVRPFSEKLARRVFCENEISFAESKANRDAAYTRLWTRKEAYFKMLGSGISNGLKSADTTALPFIVTRELDGAFLSVCGEGSPVFIKTDPAKLLAH